ncbi:MAG: OmpA family protein [Elusimicrobia bacterium]|nr:OmpA family protein [Elusimicrobiota bacterium]MBK7546155.1 OmpA family protein [Elusimicrobiota bacterium]MBK7689213.1 OmpA family protein [Elusimicrobiota bacterium]MBK8125787.1 OmpA family protein [Elusimicrobiota bacterium]MBK8422930.1 OmpA family protein [Elusimicrobiota bacterium]
MKSTWSAIVLSVVMINQGGLRAAPQIAKPLYQVTVVQSAAKAINYRNLDGSVEIDFKGTVLLPSANGMASVKNKSGVTNIKAEFENVSAPSQFGAEYLTYIFWGISPDGKATNLGELIIKDGKAEIETKTPLQTLALIVTAEPYFAVSQPSNVVVLENAIKPGNKDKIELVDAKFELLPRGDYTKNIAATDQPIQAMDKKTPFNVYQARNAVRIARAAGAETYAADGYKNAERLLALSETKAGGKKGRSMTAREAVQSAEDSRSLSVKRQADETVTSAIEEAATATVGQMKAEEAQYKAERAKGMSDTERSAALALASQAVASSNEAQADAKVARASAAQAESEKAVLRAQLLNQLNAILQTRDTARGLIVNMSDTLFQTGSSTLASPAREKLAKMAGIVASHPGLTLQVEGHTDSVGSDESNQRLSEKRAEAVREYLANQGVPGNSVTSKGFGETMPIASNDTPQGRQKNRRVEMILNGAPIQTATTTK